jgi:ATP-independent RNA helicase DbpA
MIKKFSNLNLKKEMIANLNKLGYQEMTPIQEQSIPYILEKKDIIAQAKTGSGKTAAFGIGLLNLLEVKKFRVQSLILCPTRELADQVAKELRQIAKFTHNIKILTLCGGVAFGPQLGSLRHEAHIVVGTPGRVLKHLNKGSLNLENLQTLVLDEADRMLDMGFIDEIENVLSFTPKQRQTLLFSATYPQEIVNLSSSIQKDAIEIKTKSIEIVNKIDEFFYEIQDSNKFQVLIDIFNTYKPTNVIIFCNTKVQTDNIANKLQNNDIDALALHGDMEQYDRNDVLVQFINKSARILVATDVAARGLDIKELSMVVNYDIPYSLETYTHRIGRTGRAGLDGLAFTLFNKFEVEKALEYKDTTKNFDNIEELEKAVNFSMLSENITVVIEGGKKDKLRAGDILGALTNNKKLKAKDIGKIDIFDRQSYVAIKQNSLKIAQDILSKNRIKNKNFSIWIL